MTLEALIYHSAKSNLQNAEGVGIGVVTPLDGTSTAKDAFLNIAVATATDIDADATVTISGTVRLAWVNLSS